ncbi:MAG: hypothetical protein IJT18_07210 [Oscillospiraceae bacterium]|nr:hypothetical protein [Oscillospiraceae bacterium]
MRFEPDSEWAAFYEELEPQKRGQILQALRPELLDETDRFRKQLFLERYRDKKHPDREVDNYLWHYLFLLEAYRNRLTLFSGFSRDVKRSAAALHWEEIETLPEAQQAALYLEFRNAASRYLDCCRSDQYGRTLFGLRRGSDREKLERATQDIWRMSRGVAISSGREEQMRLFCDALYDALLLFDPDAKEIYEKLEQKKG